MEVAAAGTVGATVVMVAARVEGSGEVVAVGKGTMVGRVAWMARHHLVLNKRLFLGSEGGESVGMGDPQETIATVPDFILERGSRVSVCALSGASPVLARAENLLFMLLNKSPCDLLYALSYDCQSRICQGKPSRYFSSIVVLGSLNHS